MQNFKKERCYFDSRQTRYANDCYVQKLQKKNTRLLKNSTNEICFLLILCNFFANAGQAVYTCILQYHVILRNTYIYFGRYLCWLSLSLQKKCLISKSPRATTVYGTYLHRILMNELGRVGIDTATNKSYYTSHMQALGLNLTPLLPRALILILPACLTNTIISQGRPSYAKQELQYD